MNKVQTEINKFEAQIRISRIWFSFGIAIFTLFFVFHLVDKFGKDTPDAWQWLFSQLTPTLTLITSIFVIASKQKNFKNGSFNKFYFRLAYRGSILYFVVLSVTILFIPFIESVKPELSPYDYLKSTTIYLSVLLSLVTALLGIFFVKE